MPTFHTIKETVIGGPIPDDAPLWTLTFNYDEVGQVYISEVENHVHPSDKMNIITAYLSGLLDETATPDMHPQVFEIYVETQRLLRILGTAAAAHVAEHRGFPGPDRPDNQDTP